MITIPEFIKDSYKLSNAALFAAIAHGDQTRKFTFEPYVSHPIAVAEILYKAGVTDIAMLQAALLHDVIEDTDATYTMVHNTFGYQVVTMVLGLTKASIIDEYEGNRKARHEYDVDRIEMQDYRVHTIKCADIIHNAPSMIEYGKDFAKVWLQEKKDYLEVMTKGDNDLWVRASEIVVRGLAK